MKISKKMKELIISETEYSLKKMDQTATIEEKLYYFSAVQGVLQRVFNIEFSSEILFAHSIFNQTLQAFHQKLAATKQGDVVFVIGDQHMGILAALTKEFLSNFEADNNTDDVLKKMVTLQYSITGNGNYLMEKGLLKI